MLLFSLPAVLVPGCAAGVPYCNEVYQDTLNGGWIESPKHVVMHHQQLEETVFVFFTSSVELVDCVRLLAT